MREILHEAFFGLGFGLCPDGDVTCRSSDQSERAAELSLGAADLEQVAADVANLGDGADQAAAAVQSLARSVDAYSTCIAGYTGDELNIELGFACDDLQEEARDRWLAADDALQGLADS
jgi:hypothetical protein